MNKTKKNFYAILSIGLLTVFAISCGHKAGIGGLSALPSPIVNCGGSSCLD
jgi:hypothetical protein